MNVVIKQAIDFTNVYKKYIDAPIPIREAMCFKAQYPALLPGIQEGDVFVGRRLEKRIIYVGTFWWYGFPHYTPKTPGEGKTGGFCFDFSAIYRIPKIPIKRYGNISIYIICICFLVIFNRYIL